MKDASTRDKPPRGISTLEAAIAFALLSLAFAAALPAMMGGRFLLADASMRAEALEAARRSLEAARAAASVDFRSVDPATSTRDRFTLTLGVEPDGFWIKRVTSEVGWRSPSGLPSKVRLSTLLTQPDLEDTCVSVPTGDWKRPHAEVFDLGALVGDASGTYAITDVDAYRGKLYVTGNDGSAAQPDVFVFDVADPAHPALAGTFDDDPAAKTGPAAIAVAPSGGRVYAYLASASSFTRGQLKVIDVTDPKSSAWSPPNVTYKIPAGAVPSAGLGDSIFYRRGYVYLGLTAASAGKEFDVIDARDPLHPVWRGGYSLGSHDLNAVAVRGVYAYLAHPAGASSAQEQLTVLDISDPSTPRRVSGFWSAGGIGGNGKSVAPVGAKIWLGRTASRISGSSDAIPELFALDGRDPESVPPAPLGGIALETAESVNGIVARGHLVFLLTNSRLQVWDVSDPAAPRAWTPGGTSAEFLSLSGKGAAVDCEGDTLYVGVNDASGRGSLMIVTPQP